MKRSLPCPRIVAASCYWQREVVPRVHDRTGIKELIHGHSEVAGVLRADLHETNAHTFGRDAETSAPGAGFGQILWSTGEKYSAVSEAVFSCCAPGVVTGRKWRYDAFRPAEKTWATFCCRKRPLSTQISSSWVPMATPNCWV